MKHSSAELKRMARTALAGKWKTVVMFSLLSNAITLVLSLCTSPFENSTSILGMSIYWVITIIVSLLSGLFTAGTAYFFLNICRGNEYRYGDLFHAFKANPARFIIVALITGLPTFLSTLPTYFWTPTTEDELILYSLISLVSIYIGAIISLIISLFFALSNYLLLDFPEMGAIDSLRMSARLMKGNKGRYFYISISFIGWILLSMFTLGIALLWIEPYINMTMTYFYADILNQLDNERSNDFRYEGRPADEAAPIYEEPVEEGVSAYDAPVGEGAFIYDAPVEEEASVYDAPVEEVTTVEESVVEEEIPEMENSIEN